MAKIFANGEELATNKDLQPINDKLNVQSPLFKMIVQSKDPSQDASNLLKTFSNINSDRTDGGERLRFLRTQFQSNNADYGGGVQFGMNGMVGLINLSANHKEMRVFMCTDQGKSYKWVDSVAWQSDIEELKQEISDLKKQIGGNTK